MSNDDGTTDFFTRSTSSTAAATQASAGDESKTTPVKSASGWRARIKPAHVFGAAFVVAAAWIVGAPFLSASSGQTTVPPAVDSVTARYFEDPGTPAAAVRHAQPSDEAASAVPVVASAPAPASQTSAATTDAARAIEVDALRSQVIALQAELSAAHATPAACPSAAAASGSTADVNSAKLAKPRAPRQAPVQDAGAGDRGVLSAYHLNTIYSGQAWIEGEQHTYVVEPGMSIDGMRIERIDAAKRRVMTSQGEIR